MASFLKKMKPETARKHFTDPFRYWHPVTNNNVQKLKVLPVALLVESLFLAKVQCNSQMQQQQSNTSRIQPTEQALLFCFSPRFLFSFNFNVFFIFRLLTP